jgi:hypothetical protein
MEMASKQTFLLKGINPIELDIKYGIPMTRQPSEPVTLLVDITEHTESFSFMDDTKNICKVRTSMVDYYTKQRLEHIQDIHCFWCRHPSGQLIGVPVNYIYPTLSKSYPSEITKESYTITQAIHPSDVEKISASDDVQFTLEKNGYYEVDALVCSMNCALAWISSNSIKVNPLYTRSRMLLAKLGREIYGDLFDLSKIIPAPSWRLLRAYGGDLSIADFRASFNKIEYEYLLNTTKFPQYRVLGHMFKENIKFN